MRRSTPTRYAVVSCHVERILDDRVWTAFRALAARRPGGFAIASLVRPPDPGAGESEQVWLERTTELAAFGPLGHHTHWTGPEHARPLPGLETGPRVAGEGARMRELGLAPTAFCGGGWYTDGSVAAAVAALGYVDCTPRTSRPSYLSTGPWAELAAPALVETQAGSLLAVPTTHTIGDLVRAVMRPRGLFEPVVHAYFHDTDLLDPRRRRLLELALRVLARRRTAIDVDALQALLRPIAPTVAWESIARSGAAAGQE